MNRTNQLKLICPLVCFMLLCVVAFLPRFFSKPLDKDKPPRLVPDYAQSIPLPEQDDLLCDANTTVEVTWGRGRNDDYHWKQTVYHADGTTVAAVKTLYRNDKRYLHPRGHFITYEHFRADGTLEKIRTEEPEPNLNASIICKYWIRYYAEDGKTELSAHFFRPNNKIGVLSDEVKNRFTTYRWDGVRVRSVQYTNNDGNTALRYFRQDNRTIWWEMTYQKGEDRLEIFFDYEGNPCKKSLTRQLLWEDEVEIENGGFTFTTNNIDTYENENGIQTYRQTWYSCFAPDRGISRDVLGKVEIFDAAGDKVIRTIELNLSPTGKPAVTTDSALGSPTEKEWFKGYNLEPNGYDDESEDI